MRAAQGWNRPAGPAAAQGTGSSPGDRAPSPLTRQRAGEVAALTSVPTWAISPLTHSASDRKGPELRIFPAVFPNPGRLLGLPLPCNTSPCLGGLRTAGLTLLRIPPTWEPDLAWSIFTNSGPNATWSPAEGTLWQMPLNAAASGSSSWHPRPWL